MGDEDLELKIFIVNEEGSILFGGMHSLEYFKDESLSK